MKITKLVMALAFGTVLAGPANAAYTMNITDIRDSEGNKIRAVGSGSFNLTALTHGELYSYYQPLISPINNRISIGVDGDRDPYYGIIGPSLFSNYSIVRMNAEMRSGLGVGLITSSSEFDSAYFAVPVGDIVLLAPGDYSSGTEIGATETTFFGTLAELGLQNGSYVYTWGSGVNADTLTINVGPTVSAVPEPETWTMMFVGFGLIGATARYRRRNSMVRYV